MISIVTCIYNCLDFVKKAMESVETNTDVVYEHILILNSRNQEVRDYILGLKNKKVLVPEKNIGANKGYNWGVESSFYDFVTKLDDDVIVPKGWASATMKAFELIPKLAMCATNLDWGKPQSISNLPIAVSKVSDLVIEEVTEKTGFLGFHCVTFPKKVLIELGEFPTDKLYGGDEYLMYHEALEKQYRMIYLHDFMATHLSKFKDDVRRRWQMESCLGRTHLDFEEWKSEKSQDPKISEIPEELEEEVRKKLC